MYEYVWVLKDRIVLVQVIGSVRSTWQLCRWSCCSTCVLLALDLSVGSVSSSI